MDPQQISSASLRSGTESNPSTIGDDLGFGSEPKKLVREKIKRSAQAVGAAALSLGLVGTLSLPGHAVSPEINNITIDDFSVPGQTLQTAKVNTEVLPIEAPEVEVSEEFLEQARQAREANERAQEATNGIAPLGKDIPAGDGAQGIVDAAKAQLGVSQDCTDLVQNSLAAIGVIDRRDLGGFDLGTSASEYVGLGGTAVTSGDYAPGDVLIWEGRHNAIYIGNGQAVHGGYSGNQTVVASAYIDGPPNSVVRFG